MTERSSAGPVLAWLWELPDGTKAGVVEHPSAPHWELRVMRRGQIIERERCASFPDLIAASLAAHLRAETTN